jgi:hypothetical protein
MGKPYIFISYRVVQFQGFDGIEQKILGCYKSVQDNGLIMCYDGEKHFDVSLDYILHETQPAKFNDYQEMNTYLTQWFSPDAIVKPVKGLDRVYHPKQTGEAHKKWA